MHEILNYLKTRGEQLDTEIAAATGLSLANVRRRVAELSARGEVMVCQSIRFENGEGREHTLCRISGYIPPKAPGRKPKGAVKAEV